MLSTRRVTDKLARSVAVWKFQRAFSVAAPTGPLAGLRILDLSRILAGPSATMLLGDMGATVIKIEKPLTGDDTRRYAPPFLNKNEAGEDSEIAAYFSSCNRNKYSVDLNFTKPEGQEILHKLLKNSDVVIENFKSGTLDKYGLGYSHLHEMYPGLVYCSITGFGHSGPYSKRPAYDMLIQAMGGSMSITGVPDGEPMKMGLSMFDLTAGLHACIGILAALRSKAETGLGQHVDIAMLDVSVALLQNQGMNYLAKHTRQARVGNNHPNVVPYQVMPSSDGHFILTASNDAQFENFCKVAGTEYLMEDERFNTMKARVVNRDYVTPALNEITMGQTTRWWLKNLEKANVGCAPILHLDEVFENPQVKARGMEIKMQPPGSEVPVSLIGSPMKFSSTKVNYRIPPPRLGQHTDSVLQQAGFTAAHIEKMRDLGIIGPPAEPDGLTEDQSVSEEVPEVQDISSIKGATWENIRSMSVPMPGIAPAAMPAPPRQNVKPTKFSGSTWDNVKSMSVPTAHQNFAKQAAKVSKPVPGSVGSSRPESTE
mmetsp:Transcript_135055/g.238948  ORF Transcript_135055/g.238948 Transcript_135055/m.238948 type:complete len:541 (-) Transcript_135055:75-1697(-)